MSGPARSGRGGQADGLPRWVLIPALVGAAVILVPVGAMLARVPWSRVPELLLSEGSLAALALSLQTSAVSTLVVLLLGVPIALVLARRSFPGQRFARTLVLIPLVLPPVVGGLALLFTFGRQGLFGAQLELLGVRIAFTTAAVVLAQVFVSLPFLVVALEASLRSAGTDLERTAATLGARPGTVLRRVTLPLAAPSIAAGALLAFARALGEFGATLTFAGSLQGVTRTLPLEIYLQREVDPDAALALSAVLIAVALAVLLVTAGSLRRAS
jgi:molybdate transport system permease protein